MKRTLLAACVAAAPIALVGGAATASDGETRELLLGAAIENTVDDTATLRIRPGVDADGQAFWYTVTESSTRESAKRRDVNYAPKLAHARGTAAVQSGRIIDGVLHVGATVDFSPTRVVTPDPVLGFPPLVAEPGAIGEDGYSPLVQLPNGVVLNAPHIANDTGMHDKLVMAPDLKQRTATFQETEGFYEGDEIYYVSFDASVPDIAALEGATYAPALNAAPGLGSNDKDSSARSGIAPFVNGQTGVDNPERQGLNSALLGEGDPLNVTESLPDSNRYSPLWDVHAAVWTEAAIAAGLVELQTDFDDIEDLAKDRAITGPSGRFEAIGAIVNCPIISIED